MKIHWKTLAVALALVILVVGAVVYAKIGDSTAQTPAKTETVAKAEGGSGHAEGSEACKAKHASGECKGHQSGEKGHAEGEGHTE